MHYVFGPVPSRRLGKSLGVDPIPGKKKTCNWNCIYCQLGRTRPLTNQRMEYHPREEILREVRDAIASRQPGEIDWITFVGSGETLLYKGIGWLIDEVKNLTRIPVAVITNGSLLNQEEVRQELAGADAVLPTLDAGTADLYWKINRPHPEITFERHVNGLVEFRKECQGRLWVEVMLVRGVNDNPEALEDIVRVLDRVRPDTVQINTPTRPPAEVWVQPPDPESLKAAIDTFGGIAEVIAPAQGDFDLGNADDLVEAILAIIQRHPMRQDELERTLERWSTGQVEEALRHFKNNGDAQIVERQGKRFWSAANAYFPKNDQSLRTKPRKSGSKPGNHS